ncbi:sugar kinase [Paeniglutamicibacter antarcticus]|uniref:Sugar kinase n=1 Tax=Arthrobacter terrae TaxID=2935737 RepID=A0A931CV33_9MICC|nr:sugar kinase [Arthrobacter terrae]MBG0741511.1 sugar kinase [Arthrobacter terrae]
MSTDAGPEIITIGETMLLVTPTVGEALEDAATFHLDVGGAESNLASHLASLGRCAAWVGQFGNDALGRRALRLLRGRGIDLRWARIEPSAPSGVYFKNPGHGVQYFRTGSAASLMNPGTVRDIPLEQAAVVHLSGITPALSAGCSDLADAVVRRISGSGTVLSFDVNYRAPLWDIAQAGPRLRDLARQSDLVFVGLDEAEVLWGTKTPEDVRDLLDGVPTLIIKDGDVGATEFSPTGKAFVPAMKCAVVEAVGAGDAFAAGYLDALLSGLPPERCLQAGHECAVKVLRSTGDYPLDG